jgi:hypothetical protein
MPLRKSVKHHIDKKLQFRFILYFVLTLIMTAIMFFDIYKGYISLVLVVASVTIGIIIGIITSRMYHISWNHDAKKVMAKIDTFGVIILICYIISSIFRHFIIDYYIHGPTVGAITFSFLAGTMFGRVLGTRGKILKVLHEQNLL